MKLAQVFLLILLVGSAHNAQASAAAGAGKEKPAQSLAEKFTADTLTFESLTPIDKAVLIKLNKDKSRPYTLLFWAVTKHSAPLVDCLLKVGVDPNDGQGESTPLHEAASRGLLAIVKLFIAHPSIKLEARDKRGMTPLVHATLHNQKSCFLALHNAGANVNAQIPRMGIRKHITVLHEMLQRFDAEWVEMILNAGGQVTADVEEEVATYYVNGSLLPGFTNKLNHFSAQQIKENHAKIMIMLRKTREMAAKKAAAAQAEMERVVANPEFKAAFGEQLNAREQKKRDALLKKKEEEEAARVKKQQNGLIQESDPIVEYFKLPFEERKKIDERYNKKIKNKLAKIHDQIVDEIAKEQHQQHLTQQRTKKLLEERELAEQERVQRAAKEKEIQDAIALANENARKLRERERSERVEYKKDKSYKRSFRTAQPSAAIAQAAPDKDITNKAPAAQKTAQPRKSQKQGLTAVQKLVLARERMQKENAAIEQQLKAARHAKAQQLHIKENMNAQEWHDAAPASLDGAAHPQASIRMPEADQPAAHIDDTKQKKDAMQKFLNHLHTQWLEHQAFLAQPDTDKAIAHYYPLLDTDKTDNKDN